MQMSNNDKKIIFISWSGSNTKQYAIALKSVLETVIFPKNETGLECFVSDEDIAAGTDWWVKIKNELESCSLGILCVTNENIKAPWIFYEAGAMASRDLPSIPLLIGCDINSLIGTPLQGKQCINFNDSKKFIKMMENVNEHLNLLPAPLVKSTAMVGYKQLKKDLKSIISYLENTHTINEKNTYPQNISFVRKRTVYVSVPMASISEEEYSELHKYLLGLKSLLKKIGFKGIYSSAFDINKREEFDGKTKAMEDNFKTLKEVDCILVIYPKVSPSSSLVDIGYGIALCKKMVIFYKEGLPYILEEAGQYIHHVRTYSFNDFTEISKIIESNGINLFRGGIDE